MKDLRFSADVPGEPAAPSAPGAPDMPDVPDVPDDASAEDAVGEAVPVRLIKRWRLRSGQ